MWSQNNTRNMYTLHNINKSITKICLATQSKGQNNILIKIIIVIIITMIITIIAIVTIMIIIITIMIIVITIMIIIMAIDYKN